MTVGRVLVAAHLTSAAVALCELGLWIFEGGEDFAQAAYTFGALSLLFFLVLVTLAILDAVTR